jgi:hypothetical protein
MPSRLAALFCLGLLFAFAGCAHMSDLRAAYARGQGTSASYSVSIDEAWKISLAVLQNAGAESIDEHRDKGYMLTSTAMGEGLSAGTYIGVWVEPDGAQTKVTVITKRRSSIEIITALTEKGFHQQFWDAVSALPGVHAGGAVAAPVTPAVAPPVAASAPSPPTPSGDVTKDQCIEANTKAQSLRRSGKLVSAHAQLAICIDPRCPGIVRNDCTQRLDDLERVQPTIVFDAKDAAGNDLSDVRVSMDGKPLVGRLDGTAIEVDPGPHAFTFDVSGQPSVTRGFVLKEGEKLRRERIVIGPHS